MTESLALIKDTFREALARRIFWGLFGCCTLLLLFLTFILRIDVVAGALATVSIFGNTLPTTNVQNLVQQTQSVIAMALYFMGMALAIFASAGLVAAMFEPGRIELLLSKPVSRTHLLVGRYVGNLLVVAANIIYLVGGSWLIFGIKTEVWGHRVSAFEPVHDLHVRDNAGDYRSGGRALGQRRGGDHGELRDGDRLDHRGAARGDRAAARFGSGRAMWCGCSTTRCRRLRT